MDDKPIEQKVIEGFLIFLTICFVAFYCMLVLIWRFIQKTMDAPPIDPMTKFYLKEHGYNDSPIF